MMNHSLDAGSNGDAILRKAITVPLSIERAFALWTEGIAAWWPEGHSRSGDPRTTIVIEPWVGGRFYERTSTGIEYEWGAVQIWQPPTHLAYHWYLGSGPDQPTYVDIYFSVIASSETLVQVEHRGPDLIGPLWGLNQLRYDSAWAVVLPTFYRNASKQR